MAGSRVLGSVETAGFYLAYTPQAELSFVLRNIIYGCLNPTPSSTNISLQCNCHAIRGEPARHPYMSLCLNCPLRNLVENHTEQYDQDPGVSPWNRDPS